MGLGDVINKLFKKDNGKDITADESVDTRAVDIKNKPESSRTESIHRVQTGSIEETADRPAQGQPEALDLESEETNEVNDHKLTAEHEEETQPDSSVEESAQPDDTTVEGPVSNTEQITEEKVFEVLSDIYDPEIPVDIVNLGLIYGVQVEGGIVNVKMTLTSPGCPTAGQMVQEAQMLIEELPGVKEAQVEVVWDPPWDPSKMSEEAKRALGYT